MKLKTARLFRNLVLLTLLLAIGCVNRLGPRVESENAAVPNTAGPLANGAYLVLREAPTLEKARVEGGSQVIIPYDRRKFSGAPPDEPITYVSVDPVDYVPLIIEGAPEITKDEQGKSILSVSLSRTNAAIAERFTRVHLGGRIAMLVGGEIITLHKIRSVIVGGKLQITRCDDDACQVIRAKLVE